MLGLVIDWVENIIIKGENAVILLVNQHFLLFQNQFKRLQLFWILKMPANKL